MFDSGDRAVQKWAVTRYFPTDPSRQSLQSATTEASAWFLLISITVLFVALFFHRRQAQFRGVGLVGASCPRCAGPLPSVRKATSMRETSWGGWTRDSK